MDLKSQLFNCDLDEIQGIFYQLSESFKRHGNINLKDDFNILNEIIMNLKLILQLNKIIMMIY